MGYRRIRRCVPKGLKGFKRRAGTSTALAAQGPGSAFAVRDDNVNLA
jgi:hypothetical protein